LRIRFAELSIAPIQQRLPPIPCPRTIHPNPNRTRYWFWRLILSALPEALRNAKTRQNFPRELSPAFFAPLRLCQSAAAPPSRASACNPDPVDLSSPPLSHHVALACGTCLARVGALRRAGAALPLHFHRSREREPLRSERCLARPDLPERLLLPELALHLLRERVRQRRLLPAGRRCLPDRVRPRYRALDRSSRKCNVGASWYAAAAARLNRALLRP